MAELAVAEIVALVLTLAIGICTVLSCVNCFVAEKRQRRELVEWHEKWPNSRDDLVWQWDDVFEEWIEVLEPGRCC